MATNSAGAARLRFVLFNSTFLFLAAFASRYFGAVDWLLRYDVTRVSFLILGIYVLTTAYIGIAGDRVRVESVVFLARRLTAVGLVGTVIGIMLLLHTVGTQNINDVAAIFSALVAGMSTLLITTLTGMACSLLLDFQLWLVNGAAPE